MLQEGLHHNPELARKYLEESFLALEDDIAKFIGGFRYNLSNTPRLDDKENYTAWFIREQNRLLEIMETGVLPAEGAGGMGGYLMAFSHGLIMMFMDEEYDRELISRFGQRIIDFEEKIAEVVFSTEEKMLIGRIAELWQDDSQVLHTNILEERRPKLVESYERRRYLVQKWGIQDTQYQKTSPEYNLYKKADYVANEPDHYPTKKGSSVEMIRSTAMRLVNSLTGQDFVEWEAAGKTVQQIVLNYVGDPVNAFRLQAALRILELADPENQYVNFRSAPAERANEDTERRARSMFEAVGGGNYSNLFTNRFHYEKGIESFLNGELSFKSIYLRLWMHFGASSETKNELLNKLRHSSNGDNDINGGGFETPRTEQFNPSIEDLTLLSQQLDRRYSLMSFGDSTLSPDYLITPNYGQTDKFEIVEINESRKRGEVEDIGNLIMLSTIGRQRLVNTGDSYFVSIPTPATYQVESLAGIKVGERELQEGEYELLYDPDSMSYCLKVDRDKVPIEELTKGVSFTAWFDRPDVVLEHRQEVHGTKDLSADEVLIALLDEFFDARGIRGIFASRDIMSIVAKTLSYNTTRQAKTSKYREEEYRSSFTRDYLQRRFSNEEDAHNSQGKLSKAQEKLVQDLYSLLFAIRRNKDDGRYLVTCNEAAMLAEVLMNYLEPEKEWRYVSCFTKSDSGLFAEDQYGGAHAILMSKDGEVIDITPELESEDRAAVKKLQARYFPGSS